ncbi:hypothetical protein PPL_06826 [Heterostelium album PN500]|uniref:Uncharacterized protein n=1 Tax=Heterostelium pallidum (strain ATCC 26659 / Pp 5 / PN500) TaxID=670386 RepID=D3BDM4_HETP5|nr:hypothetical protein PPL_06826 [Heterostelium album PN500]EFA80005.1 hypothetical protein PPL_06826 [Heterostelium album PN500]|eukprot:XP_020432125.1 hypothetical protein PPL_06826 [Heterostelium album PN500]
MIILELVELGNTAGVRPDRNENARSVPSVQFFFDAKSVILDSEFLSNSGVDEHSWKLAYLDDEESRGNNNKFNV